MSRAPVERDDAALELGANAFRESGRDRWVWRRWLSARRMLRDRKSLTHHIAQKPLWCTQGGFCASNWLLHRRIAAGEGDHREAMVEGAKPRAASPETPPSPSASPPPLGRVAESLQARHLPR